MNTLAGLIVSLTLAIGFVGAAGTAGAAGLSADPGQPPPAARADSTYSTWMIPRSQPVAAPPQLVHHPGRRGTGALVGLGVGAVVGFLWGYSQGDSEPGPLSLSAEGNGAVGAIVCAPVGALLGLLMAPGERWVWEDSEGHQVSVGVVPFNRGETSLFVCGRF